MRLVNEKIKCEELIRAQRTQEMRAFPPVITNRIGRSRNFRGTYIRIELRRECDHFLVRSFEFATELADFLGVTVVGLQKQIEVRIRGLHLPLGHWDASSRLIEVDNVRQSEHK